MRGSIWQAGNDDGDRIMTYRTAHGLRRHPFKPPVRCNPPRQRAISSNLPAGNLAEKFPDGPLKLTPLRSELQFADERFFSPEVAVQPPLCLIQDPGIRMFLYLLLPEIRKIFLSRNPESNKRFVLLCKYKLPYWGFISHGIQHVLSLPFEFFAVIGCPLVPAAGFQTVRFAAGGYLPRYCTAIRSSGAGSKRYRTITKKYSSGFIRR